MALHGQRPPGSLADGSPVSTIAISLIVFAFVFGGVLLGMLLHAVLPHHHLEVESKDIMKLGTGLVGTMAALILGLLVASAKGSYDTASAELTQMSANIDLLDRILALYGPETKDARLLLQGSVKRVLETMWSASDSSAEPPQAPPTSGGEALFERIQALSPTTDAQRSLQAQALSLAIDVGKTRWLMYEQMGSSVSLPLLIVVVLWLTVIFVSFGIFAPFNATAIGSLVVAAMSVSGAIFLILEMYTPYSGVVQVSSAPLRAALSQLGQ